VTLLEKAKAATAELSLWTFQQNLRARRFYERHGFVVVTETDGADNEEKTTRRALSLATRRSGGAGVTYRMGRTYWISTRLKSRH